MLRTRSQPTDLDCPERVDDRGRPRHDARRAVRVQEGKNAALRARVEQRRRGGGVQGRRGLVRSFADGLPRLCVDEGQRDEEAGRGGRQGQRLDDEELGAVRAQGARARDEDGRDDVCGAEAARGCSKCSADAGRQRERVAPALRARLDVRCRESAKGAWGRAAAPAAANLSVEAVCAGAGDDEAGEVSAVERRDAATAGARAALDERLDRADGVGEEGSEGALESRGEGGGGGEASGRRDCTTTAYAPRPEPTHLHVHDRTRSERCDGRRLAD